MIVHSQIFNLKSKKAGNLIRSIADFTIHYQSNSSNINYEELSCKCEDIF
jgi:hypothetical protein